MHPAPPSGPSLRSLPSTPQPLTSSALITASNLIGKLNWGSGEQKIVQRHGFDFQLSVAVSRETHCDWLNRAGFMNGGTSGMEVPNLSSARPRKHKSLAGYYTNRGNDLCGGKKRNRLVFNSISPGAQKLTRPLRVNSCWFNRVTFCISY